jgi:hypothetical protein
MIVHYKKKSTKHLESFTHKQICICEVEELDEELSFVTSYIGQAMSILNYFLDKET